MPAVEFDGVRVSLPDSEAVSFAFRKGRLVLQFDAFSGEVLLSTAAVLGAPETKQEASLVLTEKLDVDAPHLSPQTPFTDPAAETACLLPDFPDEEQQATKALLEAENKELTGRLELGKRSSAPLFPLFTSPPAAKRRLGRGKDGLRSPPQNSGQVSNGPSTPEKKGAAFKWEVIEADADEEGPPPCWGASLTAGGKGKVYLYGGMSDTATLRDLWLLDTNRWRWSRMSLSLPATSRAWHSATLVEHRLLVFGGEQTTVTQEGSDPVTTTFNDVAIFDTEALVWFTAHTTGEPPAARGGHTATLLGATKMLIFGGISGTKWLNDVHVLDTERWTWSKPHVKGSPPKSRSYHTASCLGHKVLVFGGNGKSKCFKQVYVLDTESWTWAQRSTEGEAPIARTGHSAVVGDDGKSIIVYGGWDYSDSYSSSKVYGDVFVLNTETWTWENILVEGAAPAPRCGHSSCLVTKFDGKKAKLVFGGQLEGERKCHHLLTLTLEH